MKPSLEVQRENTRLIKDCKRLLAMLESTSEYKNQASKRAALRGVHYVPLAECFAEDHIVSEVYAPEGDRLIDFEVEDFHWVPKKALDLTVGLLGRQFPELPVAPFMQLLTQLNQIWRARETEAVRAVQKACKAELVALKRLHKHLTPYQENVLGQKIDHLKKELKLSRAFRGCALPHTATLPPHLLP